METLGTVVVVILAVALLVAPVLLLRSKNPHPWPAIVGAMLTSGVCYTVGGGGQEASGPSVATVIASIVGPCAAFFGRHCPVSRRGRRSSRCRGTRRSAASTR